MPEGDDNDEEGNHLRKKWCTGASVYEFSKTEGLRFVDRPNLTCATTIPPMGRCIVEYYGWC